MSFGKSLKTRFFSQNSIEEPILTQKIQQKHTLKRHIRTLQNEKTSLKKFIKNMFFQTEETPKPKAYSFQDICAKTRKVPVSKPQISNDFERFSSKILEKLDKISIKIDNIQKQQKVVIPDIQIPSLPTIPQSPTSLKTKHLPISQKNLNKQRNSNAYQVFDAESNLFIRKIQKNQVLFSIFNKHFLNLYNFMQEIFNKNYQFLYKNLISMLNEYMDNPENYKSLSGKSRLSSNFASLSSVSTLCKKKCEISADCSLFDPLTNCVDSKNVEFQERNDDFKRKKWEPKYINTKKVPIPAYKLFKKQKFSYTVMPSLKEKYLSSRDFKDKEKSEEIGSLRESKEELRQNDEKLPVVKKLKKEEIKENEKIKSLRLLKEVKEENGKEESESKGILGLNLKKEESRGKSIKTKRNYENNKEINRMNSPKARINTGGDGLNLFTNFKARMSQKYKNKE